MHAERHREIEALADRAAARAHPGDRDDARSDAVLALLKLYREGTDEEFRSQAEERARKAVGRTAFARRRKELPLRGDFPVRVSEPSEPALPPMTPGRRKVFERKLVIFACVKQGVPTRVVARVLKASQSRVVAVCKEMEALL